MERNEFSTLEKYVYEKIKIEEDEGRFLLRQVNDECFANIYIDITENDEFYILELNYGKNNITKKIIKAENNQFSILKLIKKLKIQKIDILPSSPIPVLIMEKNIRNINSNIKYKYRNLIISGKIVSYKETRDDGIVYLISLNKRHYDIAN